MAAAVKVNIAQLLVRGGGRPDTGYIHPHSKKAVTAMHTANSRELLEVLLSAVPQPNVNVRNCQDDTPLMMAACYYDAKQCTMLIDAKADLNACNVHGNTALMLGVRHGKVDVVSVLLTAADARIQNKNERAALDMVPFSDALATQNAACKAIIRNHLRTPIEHVC